MILVVDDDKAVLQNISEALCALGYQTQIAVDGYDALKQVITTNFNCIILDLVMPRFNGIDLLLLMQKERITIPTIVIAQFSDFTRNEICGFPNVVEYLTKPVNINELTESLKKYIKK